MRGKRLDQRPDIDGEWVNESHVRNFRDDRERGSIQPDVLPEPRDLNQAEHRNEPIRRHKLEIERDERRSLNPRNRLGNLRRLDHEFACSFVGRHTTR